ncbi:MAG: beta-ketoacyl-[acyl-carrier-protein] synthase family protein [Deltaproteobacteria bacterium]|nr:beta-ketoacyl-[acyl-carrier-protein] synthase family protein [Deltaproteobacteria bacterium]
MGARRPVILGWDLVSPLGTELNDQWARTLAGESGVGPLTRFNPPEGFPVTIAGQVPELDVSDYPFLSPRRLALWPSPIFKHSLLVVHRALKHSGLEITKEIAPEIGVTFSPAVGGLDAVLSADRVLMNEGRLPKPYVNPNSCINMVTGKVSILTGAAGPNLSTVTACATGSTSLVVGAIMIASGMAKAFICGGVDFPLVEPIVAGFATMNGAYKAGEPEPPERASRPFSKNRRGFVVSEGAACLILADPEFAHTHGLTPIAELAGWFMNSDAGHFVAPSLPTVTRCMAGAIEHAGIEPADVDAVNAHATSTKVGDQVEAEALKTVFGRNVPPVYANKSQIGHSMGAAAAIESIWAIKGLVQGVIPPTINLDPDPDLGLECLSERMLGIDQEFVLKNAFGFGGTNCCIVLRRL